jgi:hypothetical protein
MGHGLKGLCAGSLGWLLAASALAQEPGPQVIAVPPGPVQPELSIQVLTPSHPPTGEVPQQIVLPERITSTTAVCAGVASSAPPIREQAPPAASQQVVVQINAPPTPVWTLVPAGGFPQSTVFMPMPVGTNVVAPQ